MFCSSPTNSCLNLSMLWNLPTKCQIQSLVPKLCATILHLRSRNASPSLHPNLIHSLTKEGAVGKTILLWLTVSLTLKVSCISQGHLTMWVASFDSCHPLLFFLLLFIYFFIFKSVFPLDLGREWIDIQKNIEFEGILKIINPISCPLQESFPAASPTNDHPASS